MSRFFTTCVLVLIALLTAFTLCGSWAWAPASFVPPESARIAALLEFSGPVALVRTIAGKKELSHADKKHGVPLAAFSYSDRAHSSDSIGIAVYRAGDFLDTDRYKFEMVMVKLTGKGTVGADELSPQIPKFGFFPASDGRTIGQFPMGMGPGGSAYAALLRCRDSRYELVVMQMTDAHDDEDPKCYDGRVAPKKDLKSIIEAVERLVFP